MLGYEYQLDYGETFKTMLGLGFRDKPWQKKWRLSGEKIQGSPAVGYFTNELFDPAKYKTQFPYEAFRLVTCADGFWAAKLLLSFSDDDIRALVKAGQYSDPGDTDTIAKTLIERRDMIARYWLTRSNPLDGFDFSGGKLSFKDLAADHGFAAQNGTLYHVEIAEEGKKEKLAAFETQESHFDIQPSWIPATGTARINLRVKRSEDKTPGPFVTVLLNASGIQGIRRED
jgi:hypothetical protein